MRLPLKCEADALDAGGYEADDDPDLKTPSISTRSHSLWPFLSISLAYRDARARR
jgi:hypothetical protein